MQKKVVVFILVVVAGLAGFAIFKSRQTAQLKAKTEEAQKRAETESALRQNNEEVIADLEKQKAQLRDEVHSLSTRPQTGVTQNNLTAPDSIASTNEDENGSDKGNFLAKMLENPEMKKMMRTQQKTMIDMMYGQLFKEMKLTPEQSEKLHDLLLDQQMVNMEKGMAIMRDGADKEEITKTFAEDKKSFENDVKDLLGDENFSQYQDYTKSLPDRMALTQLKSQFGDNPLTESQSTQLLALMKEERQRPLAGGEAINPEKLDMMASDEAMEKYLHQQEEINQRVLERSTQLLSPEQMGIMSTSLSNNLAMQRMGMSMAKTMFGKGKKSANPAAAK
ncbi:MAG: hypothetical protein ABJC04_01760 [Verrucomicrobiota bacterium]